VTLQTSLSRSGLPVRFSGPGASARTFPPGLFPCFKAVDINWQGEFYDGDSPEDRQFSRRAPSAVRPQGQPDISIYFVSTSELISTFFINSCNYNLTEMKKFLFYLAAIIVGGLMLVSCEKEEDFDESLLTGRWRSGTLYYRYLVKRHRVYLG
jgi:hypothetical protein